MNAASPPTYVTQGTPVHSQLPLPLANPDRPAFITTRNADEFHAIIQRVAAGEFKVEYWETVSGHPGHWRCKVRYSGE